MVRIACSGINSLVRRSRNIKHTYVHTRLLLPMYVKRYIT